MFNAKVNDKKMALYLTHYIYRNTSLEDYHCTAVQMNGEFYKKIYNIVYRKVKNVCLLHKFIVNYNGDVSLDKILATIPEELHFKFMTYIQDLKFQFDFGSGWDDVAVVEHISSNQSLTSYILSGNFKECCNNGCYLTDEVMCEINKDVYNRIYMLLSGGYFC